MTPQDLIEIYEFVKTPKPLESIGHMEQDLSQAIAYSALVGEAINEANCAYEVKCGNVVNDLMGRDDLTETARKALLLRDVAEDKKLVMDLKNLSRHLKSIQMQLFQAIRTRREER
jgi:hypothetical protein